jgi:hypothetical protein
MSIEKFITIHMSNYNDSPLKGRIPEGRCRLSNKYEGHEPFDTDHCMARDAGIKQMPVLKSKDMMG